MVRNVLNELAQQEIPPPPLDLPQEVHHRLNDRLVFWHLADLVMCGIPYALVLFMKALFSAVLVSLSGKPPSDSQSKGTQT